MDEIPIGQIIVAPNFDLSNPFCYEHHVAILVLLLPLFPFKPQPPRGTLLQCPLPGNGKLMDSVHEGCLVDMCIAIGPTGGESLCSVRVDVVVEVGKGFNKSPGLVFGLRRALACAMWRGLAFALWRGLTFALLTALAFALLRVMAFALLWAFALLRAMAFALLRAFALQRAMAFALLWAFALLRAMAFASLRALAFALLRALAFAFAFGVGHVVQVGAMWQGKFPRLNGLQ